MGKSIWGDRPRISFVLKRPDGATRRTFQVLRREVHQGRVSHATVKSERIRAINSSYLSGLQDLAACEIQAREVMADLLKIEKRVLPRIVHNSENQRALQIYFDREYSTRVFC